MIKAHERNFQVWYHARETAEYMMKHDTLVGEGIESTYYADKSLEHFAKVADAFGFDLVKRQPAPVVATILPLDAEGEAA